MGLPARRSSMRSPTVWSSMPDIDRIRDEFDRLLGGMAFRGEDETSGFVPFADLEETDDAYVVDIELPGVKRDDVEIEMSGRRLTIHGERAEKERTGLVRRTTRITGDFRYEVTLPSDVNDDACEATFDHGVLTITVPKAEQERPRKIQISS